MTDHPLRPIGATHHETPPLVLGGNVFGWTVDDDAGFRILDAFVDRGGRVIDTADVYSAWVDGYPGGESESMIGRWLRRSGKRDQVLIATKMGMLDGDGGTGLAPSHITAAADASLRRLGTDHIDIYYAHRDDDAVPQAEYLAAFGRLIDAGKIGVLGASNFRAMRLKSALDLSVSDGLPRIGVLQPHYNLASRTTFEGELQNLAVEHNLAVMPYFALASGFLTGKYRAEADLAGSARGEQVAELLRGKGPALLATMDAVAAETGATLAQVALAWLAAQPGVTAPIASATSVAQLDELVGAWSLRLDVEQLDRLTAAGA